MFRKPALYGLPDMEVGQTNVFADLTRAAQQRIKRSAHNYNVRTKMYFTTRTKDGVVYVTRIR